MLTESRRSTYFARRWRCSRIKSTDWWYRCLQRSERHHSSISKATVMQSKMAEYEAQAERCHLQVATTAAGEEIQALRREIKVLMEAAMAARDLTVQVPPVSVDETRVVVVGCTSVDTSVSQVDDDVTPLAPVSIKVTPLQATTTLDVSRSAVHACRPSWVAPQYHVKFSARRGSISPTHGQGSETSKSKSMTKSKSRTPMSPVSPVRTMMSNPRSLTYTPRSMTYTLSVPPTVSIFTRSKPQARPMSPLPAVLARSGSSTSSARSVASHTLTISTRASTATSVGHSASTRTSQVATKCTSQRTLSEAMRIATPGMLPLNTTSTWRKMAVSLRMAMSQSKASSQPPPTPGPFTAAIIGFVTLFRPSQLANILDLFAPRRLSTPHTTFRGASYGSLAYNTSLFAAACSEPEL